MVWVMGQGVNNNKKIKLQNMYLNGILQYLIWPAFIIICWFIIKAGLKLYGKKFPAEKEK
jgi:hypothetical protein